MGTNYFTSEQNGWDLWGPRNAAVWDADFADMEKHGVSMVRTGVWWGNSRIVEPSNDEAGERFLRNLEAYLLCAQAHHIVVNSTLFAFDPGTIERSMTVSQVAGPGTNPYTDPSAIKAEQAYVLSVVQRFKNIAWLCWDLINEPSYSNPKQVFHGNIPNGDPSELAAWRKWLERKYGKLSSLAQAWSVLPSESRGFDDVQLPAAEDFEIQLSAGVRSLRLVDYNLFAQEMFSAWVPSMVAAIRSTGSTQLIDVGQDEGGVNDRVLNQFYGGEGVSFTVNHTYWNNDALLWDSIASKRPGVPNIVGETGYQIVRPPSGG